MGLCFAGVPPEPPEPLEPPAPETPEPPEPLEPPAPETPGPLEPPCIVLGLRGIIFGGGIALLAELATVAAGGIGQFISGGVVGAAFATTAMTVPAAAGVIIDKTVATAARAAAGCIVDNISGGVAGAALLTAATSGIGPFISGGVVGAACATTAMAAPAATGVIIDKTVETAARTAAGCIVDNISGGDAGAALLTAPGPTLPALLTAPDPTLPALLTAPGPTLPASITSAV